MDYPVPLILREEPNYGRISRKKSVKCWLKVALYKFPKHILG